MADHIYGVTAATQTTDATATTLYSRVVDENTAIILSGHIVGAQSDYSAAAGNRVQAVVRRASGGNVTLVGSVQGDTTQEDDGVGTPAITIDVDTGTQTVRVRVTGIASETWNWAFTGSATIVDS